MLLQRVAVHKGNVECLLRLPEQPSPGGLITLITDHLLFGPLIYGETEAQLWGGAADLEAVALAGPCTLMTADASWWPGSWNSLLLLMTAEGPSVCELNDLPWFSKHNFPEGLGRWGPGNSTPFLSILCALTKCTEWLAYKQPKFKSHSSGSWTGSLVRTCLLGHSWHPLAVPSTWWKGLGDSLGPLL